MTTTKKAPAKKAPTRKDSTKKAPVKKLATVKKAAAKKAKPTAANSEPKKLSAIDAAAQILATSKEPMSAKQLIEAMATKKLWTSPGGKTPHATLYSSILREMQAKGTHARFKKIERGKFAARG
jgi:hypothetical protein